MEKRHIKGLDDKGNELVYDVILTFQNEENKKNYIIYTDNNYDSHNKLVIYAAIYDPYNENKFIGIPDIKQEWDVIFNLLNKVLVNE